jgi:hypothetical protein
MGLFNRKKERWIRVEWGYPDGTIRGGLWAKDTPAQRKYF